MNKIYRLVWNKSLNLWTVVSENARGVTKKRNVTTNTSAINISDLAAQNNEEYQPIKTLIALTIGSLLLSTGAFAATNTGGGIVSNSDGTSMAISPTTAQCGNGVGQASVNGNGGVAVGCGNNISGTDTTFQQALNNRRGTGSNNYPTGAAAITGASTAVGKNNNITGVGGATIVGNSNISDGGNFHNVAIGQGNRTGGAGYNTALGVGNDITSGTTNSSIGIGVNNRARGNTAIAMGRGVYADADFSIAQGNTATVAQAATGGIALGNSATTNGARGVAIGSATRTDGQYDPATAANADGADAIAIGTGAKAAGNQATAIGRQSTASGDKSVAVGDTTVAVGNGDVAMGQDAYARGSNNLSATAIGRASRADGEDALAVGNTAKATANYAGAVGNFAEASATNAMAVGNSAKASGDYSSAFGNFSEAAGIQSIAGGNRAKASGDYSSAYGNLAEASGRQSSAFGNVAQAIGDRSSAFGQGAQGIGNSTVAVGDSALAQGENDIAIGRNAATASGGSNNIAMGNGVTTGDTGQNVALGSGATTANSASSDGAAVAIGRDQKAQGDGAVAIGDPNQANGNGTVALGRNNTAAGSEDATQAANGAVAIGNENKALGQGAVALGNSSTAADAGAIALGDSAHAQAARGIALGSNAVATNADDVALGAGSETSTATGNGYRTDTAAPNSVVSVGSVGNERRIQNLSDGSADTDAVNVRQLRSVQNGVDQLGESTANALGGSSAYDPATGIVTAPSYTVNGNNVNNVGDAITELDKGWNLQSNGAKAGAVKAGDTVDIGTADGEENLQVAKDGNNIKYSLNRDLKVDSVTAGDTVINDNGVSINNGPSITKSGIDAAGNKVSGVADGTSASDAVNKGQLDTAAAAAKTEVEAGKNMSVDSKVGADGQTIYTVATADDVEFNSVKVGDVNIDGTTGKITGVSDGTVAANSKDAINGSQLAGTAQSVSDALGGGSAVNPDGTVTAPNYTVNGNNVNNVGDAITELDKGWNLQSNGAKAAAVKAGDTVDIGTADGEENLQVAKDGNNIKYSLNRDLKVDSVTAGDTVINDNGVSINNGPSITKSGIDAAGNKVSGVADGTSTSDAVNKGQLDTAAAAAKTEVEAGKNMSVDSKVGADGQTIYTVATADDVEFNSVKVGDVNIDGTTGKITGVSDGTVAANSKDAINGSQLAKNAQSVSDALGGGSAVNPDGTVTAPNYTVNGNNVNNVGDAITELDKGWNLQSNGAKAAAVKAGDTVDIGTADGEENLQVAKDGNNIKYSLNRDLKVDSVTAGDTVINDNGVSINNGPSITKSGIDAAGNKVSGVADGTSASDAVNKGQLDTAAAAAKTEVEAGKNMSVDSKVGADGQTIYTVATADDVEFNSVKVGDVNIDGTTGKISGVTAGDVNPDSTDAINGSQLAKNAQSVSDALGGGSAVNPDGTVTAPNYTVNGNNVNNVGDAITELDKGWNLQSNGAKAGAVKAGDTVDIGTADGEENLQVAKDGNNIKYSLNRDLKVDSVTAGDTVVNDNGVSINNGPSITKSGIDAAGNKISGVADGTSASDAVNKGQLDTAAAAAKTEVEAGKNMSVDSKVGADGQTIYTVATADDVEFNSVKVGDVNIDGTTGKITGVSDGTVAANSKDAINGSQLAGTAQSVSDALGGGSAVNPDGTVTAPNYTVNGNNVNNVGDAITALDKGWNLQSNGAKAGAVKAGDTVDIGTADGEENLQVAKDGNNIKYSLNRDLKVDSVTAGDTVVNDNGVSINNGPSITKSGIDAAGNKISGVADGTVAAGSGDAINGGQLHAQGEGVKNIIGGTTTYDPNTGKYTNPDIGGTGQDNINDAIGAVGDAAAKAKTTVTEGDNIVVTESKNADGSTNYEVATAKDVNFDSVKVGDVNIDGTTGKISGVTAGDVNPDSTDAINGSQLAKNAQSVSDALGGGSAVNPDGTVTAPNYTVNGNNVNNVGDAITALDKGWNLQSNGAKAGAVKAGDTVDIGTADGEENLQVAKDGNNIKYSLNRDLKVDSVTAGDTVINDNGVSINNGPSITKSGIDAAGNKISGVADGTVAAGSGDAINGGQLHAQGEGVKNIIGGTTTYDPNTGKYTNPDIGGTGQDNINDAIGAVGDAATKAKTTVTEGDNIVVTESKNADGSTNYEVATAKDVNFDSVKVGDVNIDGTTGKITGVSDGTVAANSKDAINGSQLAGTAQSVSDALGGGSAVNPDGTVTAPNYTVNGNNVNNVGDAITALDKGWNLQSNGAKAGAVKAGDTVDIGTADGEENLQVAKDGNNIKYSLNRDLKVDSVTAGDTVVNDNGVSINNGPSITKSGIDAAGNKVSGVADGTVAAGSGDAINGGQLHAQGEGVKNIIGGTTTYDPNTGKYTNPDIGGTGQDNINDAIGAVGDAATKAKTTVTEGDNIVVTESKNADGSTNYEVATAKDLNVDSVTAGDTRLDNNGVEVKDAVGNSTSIVAGGTIVKDAQGNSTATTAAGTTIKNVQGDSTVLNGTGLAFTDASGAPVGPSVSRTGIDAGGQKITNVVDGEVAAGSKEAVNGGQLNDSVGSVGGILGGGVTNEGGKLNGPFTVNDQGYDTVADAIKGESAKAKTEVEAGKNMSVDSKVGADGQTIYTVATADDVEFNSVKVGDVNIDGTTGKISGVTAGDVNPDSTDAINGSQLAKNAQSVSDALGGGSAVNPDGTVSAPNYTVNGNNVSNVGDAITALDKGWNLQSNGAKAGAVKAGDTVDIGTADGEENLQVAKDGNNIKYSLNRDLKVDSVTAGDTVINDNGVSINNGPSITKSGIDAAGNKISGVADGTVAAGSGDAINGGQLHAQGEGVKNIIGGTTTYDPNTGKYTNPDIGGTGQDNINDAIGAVGDAAAKAKTTVTEGDNIVVTESKNADGSTNYEVATAKDLNVDSVAAGDTVINNDGLTIAGGPSVTKDGIDVAGKKITGVADGTVAAGSRDAINGSQLAKNAQSVSDALGGGSAVNPDGTVTAPNYTVNGNNVNNVGDAITALDKGWNLQSNGANAGAVKAGDTVDIGTADGEENLQVAKDGNNIKYSLNRDLKVDSVTAGDTVINDNGVSINNGPSITKSGIDAAGNKVSGVADGTVAAGSGDAINGGQLHAQGEGVKNIIGGTTTYDPNTGKYTNPDIGGTGQDNINDAIGAVGDAATKAKTTVTEGDNIVVTESKNADGSTNYEVATAKDVNFDSVTAKDAEGNETVVTAKGTKVKDAESNEAEYGAKGISLKDQAGNATIINQNGLGFVDSMGNQVGPRITAKGIQAGNTVIGGVAAGRVAADSQDAINGSQLKGVSDSVADAIGGNTTVNPDGTIKTSNIGGTGKDNINDAIGAVGKAAQEAKSTVSEGKNIIVKESQNADGSNNYEVSTSPDLDVDSVTAGGTKVDGDGVHIDGGPSMTKEGIDAGDKKVTGVADGEIAKDSKDAINGGQLKGVSDSVAGAIGGNTTVNPDGTINTSNIGGTGHDNINDAIASVKKDAQGAKSSVSNKDGNIIVNESKKADGSTDYEVGLADKIKVKEVDADQVNAGQVKVAGDKGTTTITGGGVSITGPKGEAGPSMTTDGIHAGGKKVTEVAEGTVAKDSKDAINGGQLHQSYQDVGAALGGGAGYDPEKGWKGPSYNVAGGTQNNVGDALNAIDNRVTNLGDQLQQAFYDTNKRMDKLEDKMSAGIAATAALENAPFVPGKLTMAAGAAYYNDQSAVGVTFRRTADNGRWSLTTGAAMGSQGNSPLVRVGVSTVID